MRKHMPWQEKWSMDTSVHLPEMTSSRKFDACSCSRTQPLSEMRLSRVWLEWKWCEWVDQIDLFPYVKPAACKCWPMSRKTSFWLFVKFCVVKAEWLVCVEMEVKWVFEELPLLCWDCCCCLSRSRLWLLCVSAVVSQDKTEDCGGNSAWGECIVNSLEQDDEEIVEESKRVRLGGGYPSMSSFEFGEASIDWRSRRNES